MVYFILACFFLPIYPLHNISDFVCDWKYLVFLRKKYLLYYYSIKNSNFVETDFITSQLPNKDISIFPEFTTAVYRQSFLLRYTTGVLSDTSCVSVYQAQLNTQWNVLSASLQSLCQSGSSNTVTVTTPRDTNVPPFQVSYSPGSSPVCASRDEDVSFNLDHWFLFFWGGGISTLVHLLKIKFVSGWV